MKYGVLITDLTADEAAGIIDQLNQASQAGAKNTTSLNPILPTSDDDASSPEAIDELDSKGNPWDERIHSSSKKQNADKTWKKRKGVDKEIIAGIEEEIKQPVMTPPVPAVLIAAPAPAPVPAPVIETSKRDFQGLVAQIAKLFADKSIQPDYPNSIVTRINQAFSSEINTLTDIANDLKMVEYGWQCMDIDGKAA